MPSLDGRAQRGVVGGCLGRGSCMGARSNFRDSRASARCASATIPALGIISGVGVPLLREGRFDGGFYVTQASPRVWTPGEIALIAEVAILSWAAVARADALASLRDLNRALAGGSAERTPERARTRDVSQAVLGIA